MWKVMVEIVSAIMAMVATLAGDQVLAKWVCTFRLWWRTMASESLKKAADEQYDQLAAEWEELRKDRETKKQ